MRAKIRFLAGGFLTTTLVVISLSILPALSQAQPTPQIVSTSPVQNELHVPVSINISVTFDIDMDETSLNNSTVVVNGKLTGLHQGIISYDAFTRTATLDPDQDFAVGEVVTVVLTTGIMESGGTPRNKSYTWRFNVAVEQILDHTSSAIGPPARYAGGLPPY